MYRLDEASGVRVGKSGLFYGPVRLVGRSSVASAYQPRDAAWMKRRLCLEPLPRFEGLQAVANALNKGDLGLAEIATLHLKLEPFSPTMLTRLAKANFDPGEPRDGHGRWTNEDGESENGNHTNPGVISVSDAYEDIPAKKQRFVDAHLADAQKGADQLGVPVENILGLSALESKWGEHHFAFQGNNYFGIHYPAPFANGYVTAKENGDKIATFANYGDSLKSFIAETGSIIRNKNDPADFARALQDSRKFGINPTDGSKIPYYVSSTSSTIRHLRSFIANRNL